MAPADNSDPALAQRLADYCRMRLAHPGTVRVSGLRRIFGGASRETWRFVLHEDLGDTTRSRPLILRRDPGASLIDTERRVEFAAFQAFAGSEVPVPEALWLEEDAGPLDHPFFVMQEVTGCQSGPARLMAEPFAAHHDRIARQKWTILGRIAASDPAALATVLVPVAAPEAWRRELDHWSAVIERDALEPQPIAQAAIRWLRAHPPAPAQRIGIVHGDYRTGNFLFDAQGDIRAILDWEMVHLGDPLEDLAWGMNRSWRFQNNALVGGLATRQQAIDWWEQASGLRADPAALHWWELFSCVKGQAIWLSAARAFESGANSDLMMAFAAWMLSNSQDRAVLELMGHLK